MNAGQKQLVGTLLSHITAAVNICFWWFFYRRCRAPGWSRVAEGVRWGWRDRVCQDFVLHSHDIHSHNNNNTAKPCSRLSTAGGWPVASGHSTMHIKKNTKTHVTLAFDSWHWNSMRLQRLSRYIFVRNFSKLSAAVYELSCTQTFCRISQWWRIRKSGPVTLTFDLEILWDSSGCQGTCSRKNSSS